ncbi:MAG TPA: pitrilysin family protein [Melioribacteraceae bacterium]|nr:pitrilysin family protein [Melioribacteraceae bacterium]
MRKIFFLFLLSSYVFAQLPEINVPYKRYVLKNGLNVLLHEDHTLPLISVNTWYHVGSGNEKKGLTGFAHLFEHLMFEGSGHVSEGMFDIYLEAAGGDNNGSTSNDRTNYWETVPSNALELALYLDSDRMGYLKDAMTPEKVDGQRSVVMNEKRQSVDNAPYGKAWEYLMANLFPEGHPYHHTTIGSMEDLQAASYQDVLNFCDTYYVPNNASLAIAGDINIEETIKLVEKYYNEIPMGKQVPPVNLVHAELNENKVITLEDKVQLPRLYMAWLSTAQYLPGDCESEILANILAGGKNSRLYKKLVYDLQIAQDISAFQYNMKIGGSFIIIATAKDGISLERIKEEIIKEIDEIKNNPPTKRELERTINQFEAAYLSNLESVGGFGGKADLLNQFYFFTGNPDYFNENIARYRAVSEKDIQTYAVSYLKNNGCVVLSIVPEGKTDLAVKQNSAEVK